MSSGKNDKSDITRIEDLGEFEHDDIEEDEDLDVELNHLEEEIEDESDQDDFEDNFENNEAFEDLDLTEFESIQEDEQNNDFVHEDEDEAENEEDQEEDETEEEISDNFTNLESFNDFPSIQDDQDVQEPTPNLPAVDIEPKQIPEISQIEESLNAISYSTMTSSANPPFSLKITSLKYKEDIKDIIHILKNFNIVTTDNEADFLLSLNKGKLLIPRVSEYIALSLAHQLRKFDGDMVMGLSEDIQTSTLFNETDRGLISKQSLTRNFEMSNASSITRTEIKDVLISTLAELKGYKVHRHLGVASESTLIDMGQYTQSAQEIKETFEIITETKENVTGLSKIYQALAIKLKTQAFNQFGNAVINLNYQINPIVSDVDPRIHYYQIVCSGDIVVIESF